ncbi:DUF1351 domain-containing protein [Latilactobacillus sakei]
MTTTSTELQTQDLDFKVSYTPTEIKINNYDEMKRRIENYVDTYKGSVVTAQTVAGDKLVRQQMNKLSKALNDRRKEIKREYNKPLAAFENQIKEVDALIKSVIDPIDVGIKFVDDQEREARRLKVNDWIAEIAAKYELTPNDLDEFNDSWTNKTVTKKKVTEEIESLFMIKRKQLDQIVEYKMVVESYARANHQEPEAWVEFIDAGRTAAEVIKMIDQAVRAKHQRELADAERQRKAEEAAKAIAEMEAQQAQSKAVEVNDKHIDYETGEIIEPTPTVTETIPEVVDEAPKTIDLSLELTDVTSNQTYLLRDFLTDNQFKFTLTQK